MKVSPEARRLAKYKEKKKEISVATLQLDVTFCTPILCAPSYCLFVFVALRPMSTAMVIAGRSVHLTTLFPEQA